MRNMRNSGFGVKGEKNQWIAFCWNGKMERVMVDFGEGCCCILFTHLFFVDVYICTMYMCIYNVMKCDL